MQVEGCLAFLLVLVHCLLLHFRETYGVDWNGPTPVNADNTTVTRVNVPSARSSVPDIAWEELQHSVDRMEQSEHYAFDLYERARAILLSNL